MSFYTVLKTEMSNKEQLICALRELKNRGEILECTINEAKETAKVDRDGDILNIEKNRTGVFEVSGDARVVEAFSKRLAQIYAYESIKGSLPLDFEIAQETEIGGEIKILLKG